MASVKVVDNQNGTITVTAAGYSTAVLFVSPFDGYGGKLAMTQVASITGDGTATVSLDKGPYHAVWQVDGNLLAPKPFRVTDGDIGLHEKCLRAVRDFIISLSLPGYPVDETKHKLHKRPIRSVTEFERAGLIGVHYWKIDDSLVLSDNTRNSVTYPIQMAFLQKSDTNVAEGDWTLSRQLIVSSFTRCPLPAVPEIHTVDVQPSVLYADNELKVDLQSLIFRCVTELPAIL